MILRVLLFSVVLFTVPEGTPPVENCAATLEHRGDGVHYRIMAEEPPSSDRATAIITFQVSNGSDAEAFAACLARNGWTVKAISEIGN